MKKVLILLIAALCQNYGFAQWNTDRILANGQNALYFEDYLLSIQYFNQIIKIKPYLAEPYLSRAIAKIQLGDFQGADQDCTEAIERNPFLPQAYYARGFARRKINFLPEAIKDFTKSLEFSPSSFALLMNRMDARIETKDYKGAMEDLNLCQQLDKKKKGLFYEKARIQLAMGDTLAATESFEQNLKQDSSSSLGWSARAYLKMQKKDTEGALKDYTQAIKRKSSYVGDFINRGIIYVEKKNYKAALLDYNAAIKCDSKNALAYYNRGLLRANLGDNNNALTDLKMVIQLDPSNLEALLRKAMLEMSTGEFKSAIADYKYLIEKHPYFTPAYYGVSDAENSMGNKKSAFKYREMARNIEANKDYLQRKEKEHIAANNKVAQNTQKSTISANTTAFNRFAAQNVEETETASKYENSNRGAIQDKYTDVVNEKNFVISYYAKIDGVKPTNLYYSLIDQFNKEHNKHSALKITNNELALGTELITSQFKEISNLSKQINSEPTNTENYFRRAIAYGLVQDYPNAIEDFNKVISLNSNFMLAYFCRANLLFKSLEFHKNTNNSNNGKNIVSFDKTLLNKDESLIAEKKRMYDIDLILQDYDQVIKLNPDFTFAYYNKANIQCIQKDFQSAIKNYSKVISLDSDFVEAYFNRGLTYLYIGEDAKGLSDLSKAGELGIPKAYNLMQRFRK